MYQEIVKYYAIILGVVLILYDLFIAWLNVFKKSSAKEELRSRENLLEFPKCLPLKYIDNALLEEKMVREKYGYKRMFDSTVQDYIKARQEREGRMDHQLGIPMNKIVTDATSFDILRQPPYYEKLNYVIPADRKVYKNYDDCDEVRRIIDFPYYEGQEYIDNLFVYRDGVDKIQKFCEVSQVPRIMAKAEYR